jgi:hypothetical protein
MRLVVVLAGLLAGGTMMANAQSAVEVSGRWSVERTPESDDFRSPALGADIRIEHSGETLTVEYSLNRKRTWTLDGVERKMTIRVADAGSYIEFASARVDNGRIVLVTGRDRAGQVAREERILHLNGDTLIVEGTSWVDQKVVRTSTLTYHRSGASTD